jgi:hypothetical protein
MFSAGSRIASPDCMMVRMEHDYEGVSVAFIDGDGDAVGGEACSYYHVPVCPLFYYYIVSITHDRGRGCVNPNLQGKIPAVGCALPAVQVSDLDNAGTISHLELSMLGSLGSTLSSLAMVLEPRRTMPPSCYSCRLLHHINLSILDQQPRLLWTYKMSTFVFGLSTDPPGVVVLPWR